MMTNWEDLGVDCLVEVFKRVGIESLLLSVPFVCKSWYKATLDPKCWQILIFPDIRGLDHFPRPMIMELIHSYGLPWHNFPSLSFARFIVSRSHRSATELVLPGTCSSQALHYVSDECPELRFLGLSLDLLYQNGELVAKMIGKWKSLQVLMIGNCYMLDEIFAQIQLHCKNFRGLICCSSWIGCEEASAISSNLTQIKYLSFRKAHIPHENLVLVLKSCRNIDFLELKQCTGFDFDHDTRKMASHVKTIKFVDSSLIREDSDYDCYAEEEQARLDYYNYCLH